MNANKEEKAVKWEKQRVQRVLKHHNNEYGTHITIKDKAENVYPELKGQSNWDWVCYDTKTGEEIALEVKKLTDFKLEERGNIIWSILEEIKDDLSNKLPGTFCLYIDISNNYYLPLRGRHNMQEFKNVLYENIFQVAQMLKLEEERHLTPQVIKQLPFALPDSFFCALHKVSKEGSVLVLGSGVTGFWSRELNERELNKFKQLVSHANNEQLRVAKEEFNIKEVFLVFICEGLRLANPYTVANAIKRINYDNYSRINHIYYVSGKKVVKISLPTP